MSDTYKICNQYIMDTSDINIVFDNRGVTIALVLKIILSLIGATGEVGKLKLSTIK